MVKKIFLAKFFILFLFSVFHISPLYAEAAEEVKAFLNNLEEAVNKIETYRCVMISENRKGSLCEKKVSRFQFKKPNLMRMDVIEGQKKGSSVVLNKEGKIIGRNSMGFKKTLKADDKRLHNIRGVTFMQASVSDKVQRLKEHILKRGCKASVITEDYEGKDAYLLHIDHEDADDPVTAEDLWLEKETLTLIKNVKYEEDRKVADTAWRDFEADIPLADGLFEL